MTVLIAKFVCILSAHLLLMLTVCLVIVIVATGVFQIKIKIKKTLIIPQGAILLWSWRARKIMNT